MPNGITMRAIDAGQNFLTGQATSVFASCGIEVAGGNLYELASNIQNQAADVVGTLENGAMTMISSAGAGVGSAFGSVVGAGLALGSNVTQMADMAQEAIMDLTTYAMDLVTKKMSEITSGIPAQLTSQVAYFSKIELENSMKSIQKKFLESADVSVKKEIESHQKKGLTDIVQYATTYVNLAKTYVDKYVGYMNKFCDDIGTFALQGPQWVSGQIDNLERQYQDMVYTFVDGQATSIKNFRDKQIDNIAKGAAKQFVAKPLAALDKKMDQLSNMTNKQKQKVLTKAATAIQKAKMKLAGKLGIPPV